MATVAKKNSWYYNSSKLEKNPWLLTGGEGWGTASWLLGPEVLLERVRSSGWPPGGEVYTGRSRPRVRPLTLLYTIFDREDTSFVHLLLTNGTPFTYLV